MSLPITEPPPPGVDVVDAQWVISQVSVVRVREEADPEFSFGIITPLPNIQLVSLRPNTAYVMELAYRDQQGNEGPPVTSRF